jgi:hypothetical protein
MSIHNKLLVLNAYWMPVNVSMVKDGITMLWGGSIDASGLRQHPAKALNIEYALDKNGEYDFSAPLIMEPCNWDKWVTLPVRSYDFILKTVKGEIRCPTILIAANFKEMPKRKAKLSKNGIMERDGFRCAYSGEVLPKHKLNIDHVIAKSRGGKDTWENLVTCDKKLNSMKGDKTLEEMGWKLHVKPSKPKDLPVSMKVKNDA